MAWGLAAMLLLGLAGTIVFLVQAQQQAEAAREARGREAEARVRADQANEDLEWLRYVHEIGLAQEAWEANDAGKAWQHLDATDPTFRLWEFRYLHHLFSRNQRTLLGHLSSTSVRGVAFSPDGTRLATGGWDRTIKICEAPRTRRPRTGFQGDGEGNQEP